MSTEQFQESTSTKPMLMLSFLGSTLSITTLVFMFLAAEKAALTISFGVFTFFIVGILISLCRLELRVDAAGVHVSFLRIISRSVSHSDITSTEIEPYDWREFIGWGLRWSSSGHQAYSMLGLEHCLRLHLTDGKTLVISCRNAQQAKSVIEHYASEKQA